MSELEPGPVTHQRQCADGTWEDMPGWMSIDEHGNVVLSVLTDEEIAMAEQFSGCFTRGPT